MSTVAERAAAAEAARLPPGTGERFAGYAVMGLPFASGHVLAMRRFPASSIGPAYTSVWHREPSGRWAFWQDQPGDVACSRFFGGGTASVRHVAVDLRWPGPSTFRLEVPELGFEWTATVGTSAAALVLSAVGAALPEAAWRSPALLAATGAVAGPLLRAGRLRLAGRAPNGQRFLSAPRLVRPIVDAAARLDGVDLGLPGPVHPQAALGDFLVPQRGLFALGATRFA